MSEPERDQRLSQITTQWSQVIKAHRNASTSTVGRTRSSLLQRYVGAVYRYLLGALKNQDAAEELSHDFIVRFLQGDFHRADADRGRFRDYLRRALINMVNDYHRQQKLRPHALQLGVHEPTVPTMGDNEPEQDFAQCWREELLERTWTALRDDQANYYAVLHLRAENPDMTAREMAARLTDELNRPMTPGSMRKTLERARARFAKLLVNEVGESLHDADSRSIEAELKELNLLQFCQGALDGR